MNKITLIIIAISVIIIVGGIFAGKGIKNEIVTEGMPNSNIYVDGEDVTNLSKGLVEIGSGLLGFVIIIYSILTVAIIWVVYGIILLVVTIVKKCKQKKEQN